MKVGFIGLGVQGKYLAINVAQANHDVMAYDLRTEPLQEVVKHGARAGMSNSDVGAHGEITCVCVLDDEQLRAVVLGPDGVLAGAAPGSILVVHSTVEPRTIGDLAQHSAQHGVALVDAPVSGSEPGARNKTMSFMVGASAESYARCLPVFEASGKNMLHTGDTGTGIRMKLAHQLIVCVNMLAAYEGMRLGTAAGLAPDLLEKVMQNGAAQSRMADQWSKRKLGPHAQKVFYKDLKLCLQYANELNISVPGAALAQQLLDRIVP
ncbi:MAG: NAD(P)-dependent oxidoreductase [Pseudomonadota bacterium]